MYRKYIFIIFSIATFWTTIPKVSASTHGNLQNNTTKLPVPSNAPFIQIVIQPNPLLVHSSVNISCILFTADNNSVQQRLWLRRGSEYLAHEPITAQTTTHSLHFSLSNVTHHDAGQYACEWHMNRSILMTHSSQLHVGQPPVVPDVECYFLALVLNEVHCCLEASSVDFNYQTHLDAEVYPVNITLSANRSNVLEPQPMNVILNSQEDRVCYGSNFTNFPWSVDIRISISSFFGRDSRLVKIYNYRDFRKAEKLLKFNVTSVGTSLHVMVRDLDNRQVTVNCKWLRGCDGQHVILDERQFRRLQWNTSNITTYSHEDTEVTVDDWPANSEIKCTARVRIVFGVGPWSEETETLVCTSDDVPKFAPVLLVVTRNDKSEHALVYFEWPHLFCPMLPHILCPQVTELKDGREGVITGYPLTCTWERIHRGATPIRQKRTLTMSSDQSKRFSPLEMCPVEYAGTSSGKWTLVSLQLGACTRKGCTDRLSSWNLNETPRIQESSEMSKAFRIVREPGGNSKEVFHVILSSEVAKHQPLLLLESHVTSNDRLSLLRAHVLPPVKHIVSSDVLLTIPSFISRQTSSSKFALFFQQQLHWTPCTFRTPRDGEDMPKIVLTLEKAWFVWVTMSIRVESCDMTVGSNLLVTSIKWILTKDSVEMETGELSRLELPFTYSKSYPVMKHGIWSLKLWYKTFNSSTFQEFHKFPHLHLDSFMPIDLVLILVPIAVVVAFLGGCYFCIAQVNICSILWYLFPSIRPRKMSAFCLRCLNIKNNSPSNVVIMSEVMRNNSDYVNGHQAEPPEEGIQFLQTASNSSHTPSNGSDEQYNFPNVNTIHYNNSDHFYLPLPSYTERTSNTPAYVAR